jgi:predicted peptidase
MKLITLFLSLSLTGSLLADEAGKQVEKSLKISDSVSLPYLQYLPKDYKEGKKFPLMLFLHGRGESNGPLSVVAKWGPPKIVADGGDLPFILISPQCPTEDFWSSDTQQEQLLKLLDQVKKDFAIDESRIILTGLSMGGYGSWELAARKPTMFAAVMPICGGGKPENADKLKDVNIWVYHGTDDTAVPYQKSVDMVEAIKKAGGKTIEFTTLEGVGHNSWSTAYGDKKVWKWFANQKR